MKLSTLNQDEQQQLMETCADLVETHVDEIFLKAHQSVNSKTGDINPVQSVYLDFLKDQLTKLIYQQVKQNVTDEEIQMNSGIEFIQTFEQYMLDVKQPDFADLNFPNPEILEIPIIGKIKNITMQPKTDYKIVLTSLNNTVLTTDEHEESFYFNGTAYEHLPTDFFKNVSEEDKKLIYQYTKLSVYQYADIFGKNFRTNLDRTITSADDVKTYIYELIDNNEIYNFCNSAIEIVIWKIYPSIDECYKLDKLVYDCLDFVDHETMDGIIIDRLKELNKI